MAPTLVRGALAVLTVLLLLPAAGAEADPRVHGDAQACLDALGIDLTVVEDRSTTCVVHYAHVDDAYWPRMNTQRPPDDIPFGMHGWNSPVFTPFWGTEFVSFRFEGGGVEYRDGKPMGHNLPLVNPVTLSGRADPVLRLHLSADQVEHHTGVAPDLAEAGILPCVHIEVHMTADDPTTDGVRTLAIGHRTGHIANPGVDIPEMDCADPDGYTIDAQGITTFEVPLPGTRELPAERLSLQVHVYQLSESGEKLGLQGVRLVQGPLHLNHVVFPIEDALTVEDVTTLWYEGALYVQTNISSIFGMYDVDPDALRLDLLDSDGTVVSDGADVAVEEIIRRSSCHDCQGMPARALFKIDLAGADLPDDTYRLRITAHNLQHTAQASGETLLTLRNDGAVLTLYGDDANASSQHLIREQEEAPALPLGVLIAGLVPLVLLGRRFRG